MSVSNTKSRPMRTGIDRRQFVQLTGAVAAVAVSGAGSASAQPKAGGVLRISVPSSPNRLDPAFTINGEEYMITQSIYDNLTRLDPTFAIQPSLADSWEPGDGAKIWTFKLRQGVKFHHGKPLVAEDVVFSIQRVLDPNRGSPGRRALGPIDKVEAVDDRTVKFTLTGPFVDFPTVMSQTFARIVPKDRAENLDKAPVGTGPFKFVESIPGQHTRLAKNSEYWWTGRPYLDEVWFVNFPERAAEQAAFRANNTQIMWEVPGTLVPAMQNLTNGKLIEIASPGFQPIVMRSDKKPFEDARVRKAFKHAINREQLTQVVLKGRGTVARDNPVPPSSIFAAKVDTLPYDPALAKKLLAEAGYGSGLKLTLFASHERFGNLEAAIVAKQMLEAVGVSVEVQQLPWDRFTAEIWRKQDFFVSNWFGRPTVDEQLYPYFHSTGSWNEYYYKNARVDELLDRGRGTVDVEERKKIYAEVQQILASEGPAIIPYFSNYISAVNNRVKGYTPFALKWVELREVYLEG